MGPTNSIPHFSKGADARIGVRGIADEVEGLPIRWHKSHCQA